MGTITINALSSGNLPPSQSGWLGLNLNYNSTHVFTINNFTTETNPEYVDPEGDPLGSIKVVTTPSIGNLFVDGNAVSENDIITRGQISSGLFEYVCDPSKIEGYSDSDMTFTVSDTGSGSFTSSPKLVVFSVDYDESSENLPPKNVGDGQANIDFGDVYVFTQASLTTQLNPPYEDPEGNPPLNLLVVSVPRFGELKLDGDLVVNGQEISFDDINAGLLVYSSEQYPEGNLEGFEFRISDTGSGEYTG